MKMSIKTYMLLLSLQFLFLVADLICNTFAHLFWSDNLRLTILMFVAQDVFIICEYVFFTFALICTCVYEVGGASQIILRNCKCFLVTIVTYFLLSVSQHYWIVQHAIWSPSERWPSALTALCFMQRLTSFVYYYIYKRTALTIADPHYAEVNIDWIVRQLENNYEK